MTFLIENRLVSDSLDKANVFNNLFVSIGPKLAIVLLLLKFHAIN